MDREFVSRKLPVNFLGLIVSIAAILWFCEDILIRGKVPFFRDLGTYFYPLKFDLAESFKRGELPLWNANMAAGFPLLAAFQPGVFYPPSILFYLFPFFDAVRLTFLTHFMIAVIGAYYLCRQWKYPTDICVIGAILFTLGGTTVSLSNLLNHFQTAVWLPWMVLCWESFLKNSSWKTFVLMLLVFLSALLAGSPEIYMFSTALLVLDGIRLSWGQLERRFTWMILSIIAVNLSVALLGMIQFLPTMELLSQSRRDNSIPFEEATLWSLRPSALIGLFFPDKEVESSLSVGIRLYFARDIPFFLSHYLGILSLLGLSAWAWYASHRERLLIVSLIVVSLLLALGHWTPVYRFLYEQIAVFRIIRFPEKYVFLAYALLLFVVLKGLTRLHPLKDSELNFAVYMLSSLFVLWTIAYLLFRLAPNMLFDLITVSPYSPEPSGTSSVAATMASIFVILERQIAVTGALLALYFCTTKRVLRSSLHHGFLILIVWVDLAGVHQPFLLPLEPDAVTGVNRILANTNSNKGRLFYYPAGRNLHPSSLTVSGWPTFAKAVSLSYENLLPNAGVLYGFRYFQEIDALTRQPYNEFLDFANLISLETRIKLLRALGVHYLVSFQPLVTPGIRLLQQFPEHFSWVYEMDRPLPGAYLVSHGIYEAQAAKTLRLLSSAEFDPLQSVILDEPLAFGINQAGDGEASIIRSSNREVVIDASLRVPGFLVLTDSYYPGWKVYVDGSEGKVLRANYFFRAVSLPTGKHKVNFLYDPVSFKVGAAISGLIAALIVIVSLIVYIRQRSVSQRRPISVSLPLGSS